ncbi:MAG: porin [Desulfobacterales bacterium]|nr:porin [Desulfobacterales bacterium]
MNKWIKGAAALIAALSMAASVQAAEWNFYGNARVETFYTDVDDNAGSSSKNLVHQLQSNGRIGAKITVNDDLKARFEYGSKGDINLRQLWGEWNFGAGKLLVGQTYTPIYTVYSHTVYDSGRALEGYGSISSSREPMIRLTFGGFQIAAVEQGSTGDESKLPTIEAAYKFNFDSGELKLVGGYQTYEENDLDVDSYVLGLGGKVKFGAAYLAGTFFIGDNLGDYGFKTSPDYEADTTGANVVDAEGFGYTLVAGYKMSDMVTFEAGYGYIEAEPDTTGSEEDDASQYYLQAKITLAPGVFIVPEVGMVDEGQDSTGAEEEETTYFGAKWQINF